VFEIGRRKRVARAPLISFEELRRAALLHVRWKILEDLERHLASNTNLELAKSNQKRVF
jgi:hypothetical protein